VRAALERAAAAPLELAAKVLPGVPLRAAIAVADALAAALAGLDRRGRRAARQNLAAVFGPELSRAERRRIVRESYRNVLRNVVLLFHLQPLSAERWRRFVTLRPEDEARIRRLVAEAPRAVMTSGHFGNWELLLATRTALPWTYETAYLMETTGRPRVDALIDRLRDRGQGGGAMRKRGAFALKQALEEGRSVSLLVDRNVSSRLGGRYAPFLGIPARTTPLPAILARRYRLPLAVVLLIPEGPLRWRLWVSPDLCGEPTDDEDADVLAATERVNDVLSRVVRERPEAWAWMLKRWKSRPTPELGPYPAYSLYDPDPPAVSGSPG
jgi:KDO2-lipid IV(A) lauroyltransferase